MGYNRTAALRAELRAIELWNNLFGSDPKDEIYAAACECRQKRIAEIMTELSRDQGEHRVQTEPEHESPVNPIVLCTLAHDLQNKLSVVIGQCDLLLENTNLADESKKRIQSIRNESGAMSKLIETSACPGGTH